MMGRNRHEAKKRHSDRWVWGQNPVPKKKKKKKIGILLETKGPEKKPGEKGVWLKKRGQ